MDSLVLGLGLHWFGVVIAGLKEKYTEAMNRDDVKAIVLTGEILMFSRVFLKISCIFGALFILFTLIRRSLSKVLVFSL